MLQNNSRVSTNMYGLMVGHVFYYKVNMCVAEGRQVMRYAASC